MSSGIAFVGALAALCGAGGLSLWSKSRREQGSKLAQSFFDRQMQAAGAVTKGARTPSVTAPVVDKRNAATSAEDDGTPSAWREALARIASEFGDLMRRSSVENPRSAITIWLLVTSVAVLVSSTRVGLAMGVLACVVSVICFYAMLAWRAQRRTQRIVRQLPGFLEGIVRLVTIGNSVPAAFQSAVAGTEGSLRECLDQVLPKLRTGVEIDQALAGVGHIYRVKEFELIGAVLRISVRYGGRTDVMLDRMAAFMRDLEQADRELMALSTETRLSSWVLGLLPVLLGAAVIVMHPRYFEAMWTDELGRKLVYAAFGLQALGAYLLYRLARMRD